MLKLVVLLSVAAIASANSGLSPVAYGGVPAHSVSQYSTSVAHVHPAYYSAPAVYSTPGYHHLGKRSAVASFAYSPVVSHGYPAVYGAHSVYGAPSLADYHYLGKRSAIAPYGSVSPVAYSAYAAPSAHYSGAPVVSIYSALASSIGYPALHY